MRLKENLKACPLSNFVNTMESIVWVQIKINGIQFVIISMCLNIGIFTYTKFCQLGKYFLAGQTIFVV